MERSLSLVLDELGNISLTLEKMEAKELDKYISKNFNSSEEIRKKYAKVIDPYLEKHKAFITKVEMYNEKRYAGSVVITELQNDLTIKKKKVLYKKDIIIFKEITNNKTFIDALQIRDYINAQNADKNGESYKRIFSDYEGKEIRFRTYTPGLYKRAIGRWKNRIKESSRYYDIIRIVLKEYKNRYRELGLDSPDVVYSSYLAGLELKHQIMLEEDRQIDFEFEQAVKKGNKNNLDLDYTYVEDSVKEEEPVRYKSGADEEDYPGDLERLDNSQIDTSELTVKTEKTKTFKY